MAILKNSIRPAVMMTILLAIITGLLYPGIVTAIAQLIFPYQANGSLVTVNGNVIGSDLIGQQWTSPRYFHGRPSATLSDDGTQPQPYNAENSAASNLGPTNAKLISSVQNYAARFRQDNGLAPGTPVPVDMVTASASGLDPDISIEGARLQVKRIAQVRRLSQQTVQQIVSNNVHGRFLWIFGEPYVNVLELNMALDSAK
jgi:potassium-transporting ATPase KdpC subunit